VHIYDVPILSGIKSEKLAIFATVGTVAINMVGFWQMGPKIRSSDYLLWISDVVL
jgi:hypothetical protein